MSDFNKMVDDANERMGLISMSKDELVEMVLRLRKVARLLHDIESAINAALAATGDF